MKIQSSPLAVRTFRAEHVPAPSDLVTKIAGLRLAQAIARGRPIDLEIGCGVGWHPIRYAQENPNRTLVAIEKTSEKFEKFSERLKHHPELTNVIAVHADAVAWVTHFAPPGTFDRVFLLYPNPERKNSSARWIRMPFFGHLLETLKRGGEIEFRTNITEYADEVRRVGTEGWGLKLRGDLRLDPRAVDPAAMRTHFEQKYLGRGEACFALVLQSKA
jgi:tRNA (guanine-N7-)-methyltransferase